MASPPDGRPSLSLSLSLSLALALSLSLSLSLALALSLSLSHSQGNIHGADGTDATLETARSDATLVKARSDATLVKALCVNVKESEEERVEALTAEAERGWGDSLARLGELM
ncbi:hypothetical protein T484DRAFT_1784368 [Baffinella frigidus]|nr:hypothetical protein T484DRAFT_1784368 [Cryptophyta sp. CCMP2293]